MANSHSASDTSGSSGARQDGNAVRLILAGVAAFFLLCALLYNEWTVPLAVKLARSALDRPGTRLPDASAIRRMQGAYATLAALAALALWASGHIPALARLGRRSVVQKMVLAVLAFAVPIATLEVALRPFAERLSKSTSLFVRDDKLGWRMRPGAAEIWGGVRVHINENGLRGPALPYEKPDDTTRVLYLGDSVTFGYGIARAEDTFPFLVERRMRARGDAWETVNAGVGGYSPWQEYIYLENEGARYAPDAVVVGFVLNDVTEKFYLSRFGGQGEGHQLTQSYYSWWDKILSRSGLYYQIRNFALEFKAKRRLGSDLRLGAIRQEKLDVETLIHDADQQNVAVAWRITLDNVRSIVDFCREREIAVLLAVFPFAVQLDDPVATAAPQRTIMEFARTHDIPAVDLLPVLAARHDTAADADSLFLDHDHLTAAGHALVASVLADTLAALLRQRNVPIRK